MNQANDPVGVTATMVMDWKFKYQMLKKARDLAYRSLDGAGYTGAAYEMDRIARAYAEASGLCMDKAHQYLRS